MGDESCSSLMYVTTHVRFPLLEIEWPNSHAMNPPDSYHRSRPKCRGSCLILHPYWGLKKLHHGGIQKTDPLICRTAHVFPCLRASSKSGAGEASGVYEAVMHHARRVEIERNVEALEVCLAMPTLGGCFQKSGGLFSRTLQGLSIWGP